MSLKIVVIGGAAAGPKTAAKARRMDPDAEIVLLQKADNLSMASCGYPYFVGGLFEEELKLICTPTGVPRDPTFFFNTKGIKAMVGTEVTKIDREDKKVTARNVHTGEILEEKYDKLVIATGASPVIPPIPGTDLEGVTNLHSLEDARLLKQRVSSKSIKNAVVIGGGLIGIETAEAMALGGINVTVVERENQILSFLDPEIALHVQNHMKSKGSELITGVSVTKILGRNGKVTSVRLSDDSEIKCDLVLVAIGVKPNTQLAVDAGLDIGETGGIKTNEFLQTSDPDIYSAGDCIETTNLVSGKKTLYPMGDAANLQGRIIGQNITRGNNEKYPGAIITGICKIFDMKAGSTGLNEKDAKACGMDIETFIHVAPDKPTFMTAFPIIIKLVAEKSTGKLLGVQSVGTGDVAKRLATAAMAIHAKFSVEDMLNLDLPYAPPFSPAIDNFITAIHCLEDKLRGELNGINPAELKKRLDDGEKPYLLDVRGPDEFEEMRIGFGEHLVPLGALRANLDKLPEDKAASIIVYCKISLRGYEAALYLKSKGYTNVKVLEGGVVGWPYGREK